jgi:hypothetical protein
MKDCWSDPLILALIQFHLNSSLSSESGIIPFQAMLGSADLTYYKLDTKTRPEKLQTKYVKLLDDNLKHFEKSLVSSKTSSYLNACLARQPRISLLLLTSC